MCQGINSLMCSPPSFNPGGDTGLGLQAIKRGCFTNLPKMPESIVKRRDLSAYLYKFKNSAKFVSKMYQLKMCYVFFPPQVFLYAGSETAEGVVRVHHHVNHRVY